MPIRINMDLPALEVLESENIFVMSPERGESQKIRPLNILLLNLMPTKQETEIQLLRLLGNTPLQVNVDFIHTATHLSKNTSSSHLNTFYKVFDDIKDNRYDGMIITGALLKRWNSRKSITGTRFVRLWSGVKPMFTARCIFAGALKPVFTIILEFRNI